MGSSIILDDQLMIIFVIQRLVASSSLPVDHITSTNGLHKGSNCCISGCKDSSMETWTLHSQGFKLPFLFF